MGKLLDTKYHDTVQDVTEFYSDLIHNGLYKFNDKRPTIVTYYNINKQYSSLDPGSKLSYSPIGEDTPLRWNRINGFMVYGFSRIQTEVNYDEYGLEGAPITGEIYVMPNQITPTENDYFEVEHIKDSTWLFVITDVQSDTLSNGANCYRLAYKLEYVDHDRLMNYVVSDYTMITKRDGTNITEIVKNDNLDLAKEFDRRAVMLKSFFNDLFYNEFVQTYIYSDITEFRVYDPFMIEFLHRNHVLDNGEDSYICVTQQIPLPPTFSMDYEHTFYRAMELKDKDRMSTSDRAIIIEELKSFGTTFASRFEPYFVAKYKTPETGYKGYCLKDGLITRIKENILIDPSKDNMEVKPYWVNIIIRYFNNTIPSMDEIKSIDEWRFDNSIEAYYMIPLLIMSLETAIEKVLSQT